MLKKLINRIKFFYNIKFRFDLPAKKKLVLYDEINSSIIKKILKIDLNILPIRKREIYFWIFIKQIFFLGYLFLSRKTVKTPTIPFPATIISNFFVFIIFIFVLIFI